MAAAELTVGIFTLGERSFQAVAEVVRLPGGAEQTVASVRIRGADGAVQFDKRLPYRVERARLVETAAVNASLVEGKKGSGILLSYAVSPSAPMSGRSWQVLGVVEGQLRSFSKPVLLEGELVEDADGELVRTGWDSPLGTDVLNFRVWTGRFFVIMPLAVNWEWGYFRPAYHLAKCRWNVEAERRPAQGQSSVRLYPQPEDETSKAEDVAVTPASKVEFLGAEGGVVWDEGAEQIWLGVSEAIWLRVRIDGKEGWLREPADLNAVGLPEV